ncbi:MAG TPA: cell division protein FtsW, partial [Alphaproteobacteria bacterium]|nr:cell division protein FtsW [Alphaproteobacteria bacterium]
MKLQKARRKIQTTWWSTIDKPLFVSYTILIIIGIALVMAASPIVAKRINVSSFHFVYRQLAYIIVGFCVMIWFSTLQVATARRIAVLGFFACFALLVGVEFFGYETKGSQRWVYLGPVSIQPTEVLKPFFAVLIAWLLTRKYRDENFPGFTLSFIVCALICVFIVRQPDFSMVVNMVAIWFTQMMVVGFSMVIVIVIAILGILGMVAGYFFLDVVKNRVDSFIGNGGSDSYQTVKSIEAIKNGGILGQGPGQGKYKEFIPDCHTDFIFPVAVEELGLIFALILIGIFAFIT